MKKIALGKGLDALIGESKPKALEEESQIRMISINDITGSDYQPRQEFDSQALNDLKLSIKVKGIIQPLLVKKEGENYQIIAGERRLRAARELGIKKIPVLIKEVSGNEDLLELALIENIQREDLNPLERAQSYKRLIEEFGLNQGEVAERVGKERSSVANTIRLIELEDEIKKMIRSRELNFGQAKALLSIDDSMERIKLANRAVSEGLSVRELERITKVVFVQKERRKTTIFKIDPYIQEAEAKLREALKTKVSIKENKKGVGKIEISYFSPDERERILNIVINR